MPLIQPEEAAVELNDELLLTWTEYSTVPPVAEEAFQASEMSQEELEQMLSASATSTGTVGVVGVTGADKMKLSTVDQAETLLVVTESRA